MIMLVFLYVDLVIIIIIKNRLLIYKFRGRKNLISFWLKIQTLFFFCFLKKKVEYYFLIFLYFYFFACDNVTNI